MYVHGRIDAVDACSGAGRWPGVVSNDVDAFSQPSRRSMLAINHASLPDLTMQTFSLPTNVPKTCLAAPSHDLTIFNGDRRRTAVCTENETRRPPRSALHSQVRAETNTRSR